VIPIRTLRFRLGFLGLNSSEPSEAYEATETSRFFVDGTGFIDSFEKFKYLGSKLHYSLTSDAVVDKRIASATAAFGTKG